MSKKGKCLAHTSIQQIVKSYTDDVALVL